MCIKICIDCHRKMAGYSTDLYFPALNRPTANTQTVKLSEVRATSVPRHTGPPCYVAIDLRKIRSVFKNSFMM
jgi:hypothetical protein